MYPTIYTVITESGNRLYYGDCRYDADKALFAAAESAQMWTKDSPKPSRRIRDNFDVFPREPEYKVFAVIEEMNTLTPDERMEVMRNFCRHCGGENPDCQCWNDD